MNPLLEDFNTAPFSKISSTDYKPAIKKAIKICKKEIETIISNPETPSFQKYYRSTRIYRTKTWKNYQYFLQFKLSRDLRSYSENSPRNLTLVK